MEAVSLTSVGLVTIQVSLHCYFPIYSEDRGFHTFNYKDVAV